MTYRSPWMDDELDALREMARDFLQKEAVPRMAAWAEQQYVDGDFWAAAGALGLLSPSVPDEYGGNSGGFLHQVVITEEQSRLLDKGWGNAVHSGVVTDYILRYGTEEQKHRWLPGMVAGTTIAGIAMTEPEAGSDLRAITSVARRDGDSYVLNGTKTFITNGTTADIVIVATKLEGEDPRQVTLLVVENGMAGFRRGKSLKKIGQHAADTAELFFEDVEVPAANRLGDEGAGFPALMERMPQERLVLGVNAVVQAEKAVAITTAYVNERKAFGKTLMQQQNTRFVLAECDTLARVARVFLDDCIVRHVSEPDGLDNTTAAMAKWWLSDVQCDVVDRCLQFFGGYGYMEEYPIARMYADARVQKIYGGANEIMKEIIARSMTAERG